MNVVNSKISKLDNKLECYSNIKRSNLLFGLDILIVLVFTFFCFYMISIIPDNGKNVGALVLYLLSGISFPIIIFAGLLVNCTYIGLFNFLYVQLHNSICSIIRKEINKDKDVLCNCRIGLNKLLDIVKKVEEISFLKGSMDLYTYITVEKQNGMYKLTFRFDTINDTDIVPEDIELGKITAETSKIDDVVMMLQPEFAYNMVYKDKIDFNYLDTVYDQLLEEF